MGGRRRAFYVFGIALVITIIEVVATWVLVQRPTPSEIRYIENPDSLERREHPKSEITKQIEALMETNRSLARELEALAEQTERELSVTAHARAQK